MKILERLRKINSLRIRVFVPLIVALIFLLSSMALILQQSQQKVLELELAAKTRETERLLRDYGNEEAKKLSLALSTLTLNKELMAAFKARDRERLHDLTRSYFERLRLQYHITHLYFTGPDRVNILRVHQPERYGDRIDRFTTLEAEKTGRESHGSDLGSLGTFTLRVVTPWHDGERLLGYVELGMEVEHILEELRQILDSRVYIFVDKELIQREGWEAGIRMLGHKEEWGHFPDTVIAGEPLDQIPENVAQVMAGKHARQPAKDIHSNETYYRVAFIPLMDAGKREIGHIVILFDATARVSAFYRSVLLIGIFYVLVGAALVVFFYVFLGRIEKKQKRMEEARLEFEQKFRIILDNANDGILLADIETRKFSLGNEMISRMLGYGPEEIETLGVADIHPAKNLPRVIDQFERQQRREFAVAENLPVQRKDGSIFYADISSYPVTLGGKNYLVAFFRDITERTKAEERLRESEARYRSIFENADDIIYLLNPDGTFCSLNPAFEQITGWTAAEWISKPFAPIVHPDDLPQANAIFRKTLAGESTPSFGLRLAKKSGEYFDADLCVAPLGSDVVTGAVGIARDITERKRAEEKIRSLNDELEAKVQERTQQLLAAQEELMRKEKLVVLGQVAGSMGHELRNPLGVMSNAVYFLQTVLLDADETTKEYLNIIKDEIAGSERIVSDLLDSVRTQPPQIQTIGIVELIEQTLGKYTVPSSVTVKLDIPTTLPPLRVDPLQIHQVFRNLISNGVEAMPEGGTLEISAVENRQEGTVTVSVRDSGTGIAPDVLSKLFQPLFTTKERGIGLGLVICKNLVEANGGRIEVASEPGKGTSFTVALPVGRE